MTEKSWIETQKCAVAENLKRIRERVAEAAVRSGRSPEEVVIMGATKTVDPEIINHAVSLGLTHIGENRVQEMVSKVDRLNLDAVRAHFIGPLQTNKIRKILPFVEAIQSVDRPKLVEELGRISTQTGKITDVLVEVNIGEEPQKSGVLPAEAVELALSVSETPGLRLRGLMAVPPHTDDHVLLRNYFSRIHKLFIDIRDKKKDNRNIDVLSMGMSGDYYDAVLEGSTMVRIGSALFGSRNRADQA